MGRAFTLVELLIVIIIIAVLALVAIPKFASSSSKAKEAAIRHDLSILRGATIRFFNDTDAYPTAIGDLAATTSPSRGLNPQGSSKAIGTGKYQGPYVTHVPKSPITGADYVVVVPQDRGNVIHHPSGRASDGTDYYGW